MCEAGIAIIIFGIDQDRSKLLVCHDESSVVLGPITIMTVMGGAMIKSAY